MMTAEEKVNAVLMHHGIEGQKWGVRHGPPYPLDRKTSSKIKNGEPVTPKKRSILDLFRKPEEKKEEKEETPLDKFMDSGLFDGISPFDTPEFSGSKLKNLMSDETYKKFKNYQDYMDGIVKEAFEKGAKTKEEYSIHDDTDDDSYSFYKWEDFKGDPTNWNKETMVYARPTNGGVWWLMLNTSSPGFNEEYSYGRSAQISLLDADKEKLQSIVDKYPETEYDWTKPKFDGNKLTGFEKKKLQHSALEYEIVDDVLEHYGIKGMKWGKHLKAKDYTVADYIKEHPEYADVLKMANKDAKISTDRLPKSREFTSMIGSGNERTTKQLVVPYVTDLMDELRSEAYEKSHPEEAEKIKSITGEKYTKSELDKLESDIKSGKASGELESVYLRKMNLYLQDDSVNKELKDFMKEKLFSDEKWYTTDVDYKNKNIVCSRVMDGKEETKKFKFPLSVKQSALAEEKVGLYLEHHGILGMKWGVKHGPPYPLDRKTSSKIKKSGKVKIDIRDLDDEDLRRIVQRLNLEKQLKELTKKDTEKSKSFASKTLEKFRDKTVDAVINMFTKSVESAGTKKLTALLNEKLNKESSE